MKRASCDYAFLLDLPFCFLLDRSAAQWRDDKGEMALFHKQWLLGTAASSGLPTPVILEKFREFLLEGFDLRTVADHDVWVVGIVQGVILVVVLSIVKAL